MASLGGKRQMNLPNKLTLGRVILVPFFIAAYLTSMYWAALVIFCVASITDYFDGMLARKNHLVTNFGKIMDPLADKILVYSALCLFIESGVIKAWMLILILAREFAIAGMRTVAASEGRVLAAGMSGKVKTVLQMVSVIVFLLALSLGYQDPATSAGTASATVMMIGNITFYAALIMTVYSGCEYIIKNKDIFSM